MSAQPNSNCLKFSPVLFFLLFFQISLAQTNKKNPKELGIETHSELDASVQYNAKALGNDLVAMLWTDTLVYKRELGQFDSRTVVPVTGASKWLTTVLVLKMVEEGKISLDDKVGQYIPIFDTYGKSYITLRHCLSNFTGIQSDNKLFSRKKFKSLQEEVESYAKKEIQSNPGEEFRYNDLGFNIAGRVLEIVSKKKFDMLIKQKLFNPLGMRRSTFSTMDGSAIDPANGGQSSADEMMRFLQMLLNNGKINGQQFLSEESVNELRTITAKAEQIVTPPRTVAEYGYALGSWVIESGEDNQATALSGAALTGTWPLVDWCRGYAFLVLTKRANSEQKKEGYVQMKEAIDNSVQSNCN